MINTKLLIMGCGGHARSIADVALSCGFQTLIFVDSNAKPQEQWCGFDILSTVGEGPWQCLLGAGDSYNREQQWHEAAERNWFMLTLFSLNATRGIGSQVGEGSVVLHHAHLGPLSCIGKGSIVNTAAIIEHDCRVGDFCHIAVNATLAGQVVLGHHVMIGAGAVVKQDVCISDNVIIGAGATVIHNIQEPGVYVGTPARLLKQ